MLENISLWEWVSALLALSLCLVYTYTRVTRSRKSLPLPPGPKGYPIIGNLFDFPRVHLGREFRDMGNLYGDTVYLNVLGQSTVVLNSYQAACDLLDKRSSNYSDRPPFIMGELTSFTEWNLPGMRYGPLWRTHRRTFHQQLLPEVVSRYQHIQLQQTHELLRNLLESPKSFYRNIELTISALALRIAYGLEASKDEEHYTRLLRDLVEVGADFSVPGRYLVEAFPTLRYLPSWLPGTGFKRKAAEARIRVLKIVKELFEAGKREAQEKCTHDSIMTAMLQRASQCDGETAAEIEDLCASVIATLYTAGADTSESSIQAFFLAMALYPEVQQKAQLELDTVIGRDRLPEFSDRGSLPYVNALIKELLRWHVVVTTGFAHAAIDDDEYDGYLIPKGAVVLPNAWAMSRDYHVYPDPERFDPERFLQDGKPRNDILDPSAFVFGFGRRICPGRHLADTTLFIVCASVLHAFSIAPPVDELGGVMPLEAKFVTNMITSHPEKFQCQVQPRSAEMASLIISSTG